MKWKWSKECGEQQNKVGGVVKTIRTFIIKVIFHNCHQWGHLTKQQNSMKNRTRLFNIGIENKAICLHKLMIITWINIMWCWHTNFNDHLKRQFTLMYLCFVLISFIMMRSRSSNFPAHRTNWGLKNNKYNLILTLKYFSQ
jgi:hypothetical protein